MLARCGRDAHGEQVLSELVRFVSQRARGRRKALKGFVKRARGRGGAWVLLAAELEQRVAERLGEQGLRFGA